MKPESGQPARIGISLPSNSLVMYPIPSPGLQGHNVARRRAPSGQLLRMRTPTCPDGWVTLHDSVKSPCGRASVGSHYLYGSWNVRWLNSHG